MIKCVSKYYRLFVQDDNMLFVQDDNINNRHMTSCLSSVLCWSTMHPETKRKHYFSVPLHAFSLVARWIWPSAKQGCRGAPSFLLWTWSAGIYYRRCGPGIKSGTHFRNSNNMRRLHWFIINTVLVLGVSLWLC